MRALLFVVLGLVIATASADARPRAKARAKKRVAIAKQVERELVKPIDKPKSRGQSFGAPWSGTLRNASKFREPKRTHVRRPQRAFATRTTVDLTRRAIIETLESFPKAHEYAIGDFSAPRGGAITEHHSHQSGRDVDLGLFYKKKPDGYPDAFVTADKTTLHSAAMWSLITNLASTRDDDGGVYVMFLDFELQGVIYKWAKENGVSEERLGRIFQYPHGRGASAGLVRHEPNHNNHLHVRFQCAAADTGCR